MSKRAALGLACAIFWVSGSGSQAQNAGTGDDMPWSAAARLLREKLSPDPEPTLVMPDPVRPLRERTSRRPRSYEPPDDESEPVAVGQVLGRETRTGDVPLICSNCR